MDWSYDDEAVDAAAAAAQERLYNGSAELVDHAAPRRKDLKSR